MAITDLRDAQSTSGCDPFRPGAMALVTLNNPREKFWGAILAVTPQGISICGVELNSFDDLVTMVKAGEPASCAVVFFPLHRVERAELDKPDGQIPSLSERFTGKTGIEASSFMSGHATGNLRMGAETK